MKIKQKTKTFTKDGQKMVEKSINREDGIHVKFIPPAKWWNRAKWELLKEYTSHNGEVVVPVGFVSDGATIIWALRWLFSPTGEYFSAAIIHDYLIDELNDWDAANEQFEIEMSYLGVDSWRRNLMVGAVKLWSWLKKLFS